MYLAHGHSIMTVVPRLGIEPGTPGFEIPDANNSTTEDFYGFETERPILEPHSQVLWSNSLRQGTFSSPVLVCVPKDHK